MAIEKFHCTTVLFAIYLYRTPHFEAEDHYPDLSQHNNWMAKCLTPAIYKKLYSLKTVNGFTLDRAIQTGVDNPGHPFIMTVGMVAGDEESYEVFADLFDPVIEARHNGYKKTDVHTTDLDASKLQGGDDLDPNYVLSSRVRTGRSIRGFSLPPFCSRAERREVERIVTTTLESFDGTFKGKYYPLTNMTEEDQQQLIDDHFLFDKPVSPLLLASRMARDWPDARGIWHNEDKNFLVWVNEEDHTRVISMQKGGNMKEVFTRFCDGLKKFESIMKEASESFMWNEHLGFILTCPSNLGTGLRAGVHVKLPLLSKLSFFKEIIDELQLQTRGVGGVDTAAVGGVYDISNSDRLGVSEVQLVQKVVDGVKALVAMEKCLEKNGQLHILLPEKLQQKYSTLTDYPDLEGHNNHMAHCLGPDVFLKLAPLKTPNGFTLNGAIQTGVDNPGHPFIMTVGMVAGDEESYEVFADLFDPVIEARHNGYKKTDVHTTDLDASKLQGGDDLDPNYVLSSRVRTGRSIRGFSLPPFCSRAERREVERIVSTTLESFDGPFKGKYYPLTNMTEEDQQQLIDDHFLFDKPVSPLLLASRMARDWPDARGIWHNEDKNFLVWVNEEDHTRVISMQKGGNMKEVFTRFCDGLNKFESIIKEAGKSFMWNEHLGFILTCPSNLGTGLRAGVHVKLPFLSKDNRFSSILESLRLQKRGTGGVDTASTDGIFDISNSDRLGFSEVQLVQQVADGVQLLIKMEKILEKQLLIDNLIPGVGKESCDPNYPDLSKHNNWMAKCLTPKIYSKLVDKKTPNGFTLDRAIQTGVDNPGHPFIMTVGMVAGDEESYEVFADLFDPVIEARHNGFKKTDIHTTDLDASKLQGGDDLDPNYVLSSRVRTGRSIRGFSLPPFCSRAERREVEKIVLNILKSFDGPFKGKYYPLTNMTEKDQQQLIDDHFLFDKPVSPLLLASRMARDWPDARGIWHNEDKNFLVWVNEEDHTRVISMQKGGNMKEVFTRFCDGLNKFESIMKEVNQSFMWNEHLGYILTCPSNLGTGLRAGVHVKLPLLSKDNRFSSILESLRLQKRGTGGVDTASTDGIFDISNSDRLGFSEVQLVQQVIDGVQLLIKMEKTLEKQLLIDNLIPGVGKESCDPNYPDLSKHNNWMAKCLTPKIYSKLVDKKTPNGFRLDRAIQTGVDNPGHPFIMTVGMVAGDEESYEVFADLFDPVIEARHNGFKKTDIHTTDLDASKLQGGDDLDPNYVLSSRARTGRSIRGFSLPPFCSRAERREVEKIVSTTLESFDGPFKGKYYPLTNMTEEEQQQLIDDHFLFDKPVSPLLLASRMARDWPDARGIWHNEDKNFLVWVNEEDHTRVISMQKGGNMKEVFTRFCDGLNKFESIMNKAGQSFMWNVHLGFILTCPSNLGTGLRAGVHVKLPLLSKLSFFKEIIDELQLQTRGVGGVDTAAVGGVYDISNSDRLGVSEVQLVQKVVDGVKALVAMEKCLEKNGQLHILLPEKLQQKYSTLTDYPDLEGHNNHMAHCLGPDVFLKLAPLKTPNGFTLNGAIQTGVDNPGHPFIMTVGMVAGDEESYEVFANLFDPVIEARHNGYKKTDVHTTDLDASKLQGGDDLDPNYVLSSRVRTGRSIRGFSLPPFCSRAERREVERIVSTTLESFDGPFKGKYYPLTNMTEEDQQQLIDDHFLFDKPVSPLLLASRMARDWPDARGIWHNEDKNFLVWVNEEDHTRVISMQKGGNMKEVFTRFCDGLKKFESIMKEAGKSFMWNEHLGFILTCPSNLGTGLRAGVHVKLPFLSKDNRFSSILETLQLQKRGTGGVDTASTDGIFDISNSDRLGFSEVQLVQKVVDGVKLLVKMEQHLEEEKSIDSLIPS